jgi:hypothetical protein
MENLDMNTDVSINDFQQSMDDSSQLQMKIALISANANAEIAMAQSVKDAFSKLR